MLTKKQISEIELNISTALVRISKRSGVELTHKLVKSSKDGFEIQIVGKPEGDKPNKKPAAKTNEKPAAKTDKPSQEASTNGRKRRVQVEKVDAEEKPVRNVKKETKVELPEYSTKLIGRLGKATLVDLTKADYAAFLGDKSQGGKAAKFNTAARKYLGANCFKHYSEPGLVDKKVAYELGLMNVKRIKGIDLSEVARKGA